MGDLTSFVPPATTTTPASVAAPAPCRRVHFLDFPSSALCLPRAGAGDDPMAEEDEPPPPPLGPEKETGEGELEEEEDSMDLLWEDFNEELLGAMHRARAVSCSSTVSSDEDGEESNSAAARAPAGCFPVLRPSARAGGAGHYRRRAGTWVLLMRIFRRLFVIDKTTTVSSAAAFARRHGTSS